MAELTKEQRARLEEFTNGFANAPHGDPIMAKLEEQELIQKGPVFAAGHGQPWVLRRAGYEQLGWEVPASVEDVQS